MPMLFHFMRGGVHRYTNHFREGRGYCYTLICIYTSAEHPCLYTSDVVRYRWRFWSISICTTLSYLSIDHIPLAHSTQILVPFHNILIATQLAPNCRIFFLRTFRSTSEQKLFSKTLNFSVNSKSS
jgi:hypothetical protein